MPISSRSPENNPASSGSTVGVVGLGLMGRNLVLNMLDHGLAVVAFSYDAAERVNPLLNHPNLMVVEDLSALFNALDKPTRILLMVTAGDPVDQVISDLTAGLQENDILMDGGNSNFQDTLRRQERLSKKGIHFLGCGISGGAKGQRHWHPCPT